MATMNTRTLFSPAIVAAPPCHPAHPFCQWIFRICCFLSKSGWVQLNFSSNAQIIFFGREDGYMMLFQRDKENDFMAGAHTHTHPPTYRSSCSHCHTAVASRRNCEACTKCCCLLQCIHCSFQPFCCVLAHLQEFTVYGKLGMLKRFILGHDKTWVGWEHHDYVISVWLFQHFLGVILPFDRPHLGSTRSIIRWDL